LVKSVSYTGSNVGGEDEEGVDTSQSGATVQMADSGAQPDVEPEADAAGQVSKRQTRVARAVPVATPPEKRGFFQRLFGHRNPPAAIPPPTPTPSRRSRGF
jgi:hypothetical protein